MTVHAGTIHEALANCPECEGSGYVWAWGPDEDQCPACRGDGVIDPDTAEQGFDPDYCRESSPFECLYCGHAPQPGERLGRCDHGYLCEGCLSDPENLDEGVLGVLIVS